jgi:hypothetical protein
MHVTYMQNAVMISDSEVHFLAKEVRFPVVQRRNEDL